MRKKTRQEIRNESPDRQVGKKKKVYKPFVVQRKMLNPSPMDFLNALLGVWHGDHKFATMEAAEAYVAKQQRVNHLVHYEFRILNKDIENDET
jgi:hypothetical protein